MSLNYNHVSWNEILNHLDTLNIANGGFTNSLSGVIDLKEKGSYFVKLAQDPENAFWVAKEIQAYQILNKIDFPYTPKLIAVESNNRGFATQALLSGDGWIWTDIWNEKRLEATFKTKEALSSLELTQEDKKIFNSHRGSYFHNGWIAINNNYDKTRFVYDKADKSINLDILKELYVIQDFNPKRDTLVHNDLRTGNTSFSEKNGVVMFVDWPWAEIGDKNLDTNALLVNVACTGLKIPHKYVELLRRKELHWLAGFWFDCAYKTWGEEKIKLSDSFLRSANKALALAKEI